MADVQPTLPFDVCARKHGGHRNSVAANKRVQPKKASLRERVRGFVHGCGFHGTTLKKISDTFGIPMHSLSGRLTELKKLGQVFDCGRDADGFSRYVADEKWVNGSYQ